jgi:hypothetical protein
MDGHASVDDNLGAGNELRELEPWRAAARGQAIPWLASASPLK